MGKRLTNEEFKKRCSDSHLLMPLSKYINCRTQIKVRCKNCNKILWEYPRSYLKSSGLCKDCLRKSMFKPSSIFVKECKLKGLDLPVENYKGANKLIKFKCQQCGGLYTQTPSAHLKGEGHFKCNGGHKKTPKEYFTECEQEGLDLPVEDYVTQGIRIKHKCKICGKEYRIAPKLHLRGVQHKVHNFSHGERLIYTWLVSHKIQFEYQKRFDGLKTKNVNLSYDFYIPSLKL